MSQSRLIFYSLLIISGYFAYRTGMKNSQIEPISKTRNVHVNLLNHSDQRLEINQTALVSKNAYFADANFSTQEDFEQLLNQINPQNDWLVTLDPEHKEKLLKNPSRLGIRVIDEIPELGVVRFSISSFNRAFPFINEMFLGNKLSINHPLRQPLAPRSDTLFEGKPFDDSFIDWMGGSINRKELGRGVKVAVLDSGIDTSHPLLKGVNISQVDLVTAQPEVDLIPKNAHGTAIASVISSHTDSYSGIAPGSQILSYRIIDKTGNTNSFIVASAIISAVKNGADVINLSLGGEESSEILQHAVNYSLDNGVPLVAAVGNEGIGLVNYPAAYDGVIGVTSVDKSGRVSSFSNFGKGVDFAAPGVGVLTAWESSQMASFSGTSISCAMVTGAIAIELSRQPSLSPSEIEQILMKYSNETDKPGHDLVSGHGIISLSRLENQNNPDYSDPAIVGYHFEHLDGLNSGTLPFDILVQNQGNTWVGDLSLQVNFLGTEKSFRIDNLGPGEVRAEKLYLQGSEFDRSIEIKSHLIIPKALKDNRPENNIRNSVINL